jgi:hypothetical protein
LPVRLRGRDDGVGRKIENMQDEFVPMLGLQPERSDDLAGKSFRAARCASAMLGALAPSRSGRRVRAALWPGGFAAAF